MSDEERRHGEAAASYLEKMAEHIRQGDVRALALEWDGGPSISCKFVPKHPVVFTAQYLVVEE